MKRFITFACWLNDPHTCRYLGLLAFTTWFFIALGLSLAIAVEPIKLSPIDSLRLRDVQLAWQTANTELIVAQNKRDQAQQHFISLVNELKTTYKCPDCDLDIQSLILKPKPEPAKSAKPKGETNVPNQPAKPTK